MRFSWQLLRRKPEGFDLLSHGRFPTLRASFAAIIGEGKALERTEDVRRLWFEIRENGFIVAEGLLMALPTDASKLTDGFLAAMGGVR